MTATLGRAVSRTCSLLATLEGLHRISIIQLRPRAPTRIDVISRVLGRLSHEAESDTRRYANAAHIRRKLAQLPPALAFPAKTRRLDSARRC